MSTSCDRYLVRIVLLAPDRSEDVRGEGNRLMEALAESREPAVEGVMVESDADDATVIVDATVVAGSGQAAEVALGAVVLLLTTWSVVATSHEAMRVDG